MGRAYTAKPAAADTDPPDGWDEDWPYPPDSTSHPPGYTPEHDVTITAPTGNVLFVTGETRSLITQTELAITDKVWFAAYCAVGDIVTITVTIDGVDAKLREWPSGSHAASLEKAITVADASTDMEIPLEILAASAPAGGESIVITASVAFTEGGTIAHEITRTITSLSNLSLSWTGTVTKIADSVVYLSVGNPAACSLVPGSSWFTAAYWGYLFTPPSTVRYNSWAWVLANYYNTATPTWYSADASEGYFIMLDIDDGNGKLYAKRDKVDGLLGEYTIETPFGAGYTSTIGAITVSAA